MSLAFANPVDTYLYIANNRDTRKNVKYVQSLQQKHQNDVNYLTLVFSLLTLDIFHIFKRVSIDFEKIVSWEGGYFHEFANGRCGPFTPSVQIERLLNNSQSKIPMNFPTDSLPRRHRTRKLNVHKTFSLSPVSTGFHLIFLKYKQQFRLLNMPSQC